MSENFENNVSSQRVVRRGIVPRLTIRVGYGTMSFFLPRTDGTVEYLPYTWQQICVLLSVSWNCSGNVMTVLCSLC